MTNLILFIMMYPIILILYFVYKAMGKANSHMLFAIHYSKDWLTDEEVNQYETEYRRSMNHFLLQYSLLSLPTLICPYLSISVSYWMIWMIVTIVMSMAPYFKSNRKLLALKKKRCGLPETEPLTYAELKQAGNVRCIKWQQFIGPISISILLAVISLLYFFQAQLMVLSITVGVLALCTPLLYLGSICTDRLKTKVISSNSDVNVNYARACKNIYKSFWIGSTWITTGYTAIIFTVLVLTHSFNILAMNIMIWGTILYTLILLLLGMKMFGQQQKLRKQYERHMDLVTSNNEESWIGGMFYYNPKDKRSMVENPQGTGTTVNMATPAGKVTMGFIGLMLISFVGICLWIILEEFTPISLSIQDDVVVAAHLKKEYVIDADSITELSLVKELPIVRRNSGTSLKHLKKGNYRSKEDGKILILLNPQNQYHLRIVADETTYYLGGYDDTETLTVYSQLSGN